MKRKDPWTSLKESFTCPRLIHFPSDISVPSIKRSKGYLHRNKRRVSCDSYQFCVLLKLQIKFKVGGPINTNIK